MTSTQNIIPIEDIRNNLVFLKNGAISMVIQTSAVNFALLFETEQYSIIQSFAGMLNSLSFPIQIVIRSKRMDVTSYLSTIEKAIEKQNNPLLSEMTKRYKQYVESLIKENNVLDKKFYVCITANPLELGVFSKITPEKVQKAITILTPRRDHVLRQLARIGLKARQLENEELVKLFYDIYNPSYDNISNNRPVQDEIPKPKMVGNSLSIPILGQTPSTVKTETQNHPLLNQTQNPPQPKESVFIKQQVPIPSQPVSQEEPVSNVPQFEATLDIPQQETFQLPAMQVLVDQNTDSSKTSSQKSTGGGIPFIRNLTPPFVIEELVDEIWPKAPGS